jgi:uncharacterized protein (TIGR02996 family)
VVTTRRLSSLLESILEHPEDDSLRLVYADALEEAGETLRAELIRVDIGGGGGDTRDTQRNKRRGEALRSQNGDVLAGPVIGKYARRWAFARGLVSEIVIELEVLAAHGEEVLRAAPIHRVSLIGSSEDEEEKEERDPSELGEALAKIRGLERVTDLEAIQCGLDAELLEKWFVSPHLCSLRHLAFMFAEEAEVAELLAKRALLPALRELLFWMESGSGGDRVAEHIAGSPLRRDLERLEISGCELSDSGVRSIAESEHLHSLKHLLFGSSHYSSTSLSADSMTALVEAKNLTKLVTLEMTDCALTDSAARILGSASARESLPSLKHLNLDGNALTSKGVSFLLRGPVAAHLETLSLGGNPVRKDEIDAALASLKPSPTVRVTGGSA